MSVSVFLYTSALSGMSLFLTDPLNLCQFGWEASAIIFQAFSWLHALGHCHVFVPVTGHMQSGEDFL